MAEDVVTMTPTAQLGPERAERARKSGYHFRFSLVYALLAAVAAASIAALVVVVTRPDAAKSQNWSKFEPASRTSRCLPGRWRSAGCGTPSGP